MVTSIAGGGGGKVLLGWTEAGAEAPAFFLWRMIAEAGQAQCPRDIASIAASRAKAEKMVYWSADLAALIRSNALPRRPWQRSSNVSASPRSHPLSIRTASFTLPPAALSASRASL